MTTSTRQPAHAVASAPVPCRRAGRLLIAAVLIALLSVAGCKRPPDKKPVGDPWKSVEPKRPVETLWSRSYDAGDAAGSRFDEARAVALGPSGVVIVTGYSKTRATGEDCVTVAYDAAGKQIWVDRYASGGGDRDRCYGIGVDRDGTAYVVGVTTRPDRGLDFLTIAFAPDGKRKWVARYDGTAHGRDRGALIALPTDGGVLVGGTSLGEATGSDMVAVRYEADGAESWACRFDDGRREESAQALAALNDGDALLAGASRGVGVVVVGIDAAGKTVWSAVLKDGRNVLGVGADREDAVYLLAQSVDDRGRFGLALVRYSPDGQETWVRRREANDREYDGGLLAVAPTGDAAIACDRDGFSRTIAYGAAGTVRWESSWLFGRTKDVSTDADGGTVVTLIRDTGGGGRQALTQRFAPNGDRTWARVYDGPTERPGVPETFALDPRGGAVMTGFSASSDTRIDYQTVRYRFP